jgi:protein phosphatase
MGGHEAGEVASEMAATTLNDFIRGELQHKQQLSGANIRSILVEGIKTTNTHIYQAGQELEQKRPMGTTILAALVQPSMAYISHVGDSRAYLAREGSLIRLTEDDSWNALLASKGLPVDLEGKGPMAHVLTQAIGHRPEVKPSFREVVLLPGDWLLLCSDGLWNMLPDDQINARLNTNKSGPSEVVESLVAAANEAGGKDNISVITINIAA